MNTNSSSKRVKQDTASAMLRCAIAFVFAGLAYAADPGDARLVEAARTQDQKTIRALLSQKVDVNARASDGSTALLWLAHWNDAETADLLAAGGRYWALLNRQQLEDSIESDGADELAEHGTEDTIIA